MGWRESVVDLARRYDMDPDELDKWLTLTKQGYESLAEDLEHELNTKDGGRILNRLQSLVNAASPDLKMIQQQLNKAETMRVWLRTYPLIEGPLVDRILQRDEITKDDLDALRRNVAHIIKQKRTRKTGRGPDHDLRDWLIFELSGLWTELTERKATYTSNPYTETRTGDFIDFATSAAGIIGANPKSIPERIVDIKIAKIAEMAKP